GLTHTFPSPADVAGGDLDHLGLTGARADAVRRFAAGVESGALPLDGRAGLDELVDAVTTISGLGPWTAHYLALRCGEPDAFPMTDLGLRRSFRRLADANGGVDTPL